MRYNGRRMIEVVMYVSLLVHDHVISVIRAQQRIERLLERSSAENIIDL